MPMPSSLPSPSSILSKSCSVNIPGIFDRLMACVLVANKREERGTFTVLVFFGTVFLPLLPAFILQDKREGFSCKLWCPQTPVLVLVLWTCSCSLCLASSKVMVSFRLVRTAVGREVLMLQMSSTLLLDCASSVDRGTSCKHKNKGTLQKFSNIL